MLLHDVGTVIAVRSFDVVGGNKVTLTIGKPEPFPDGQDYYCPYRISGIGSGKVWYAGGVDAIQALIMALKLADVGLRASKEYKAGALSWDGANVAGGLGLPQLDG